MSKIKCDDCGWIGYHEELKRVEESRGEFWGAPAYETMYYCPCCGSEDLDEYHGEDNDDEDEDEDPSEHEAYLESDEYEYFKKLGAFDIDLAREASFSEIYD